MRKGIVAISTAPGVRSGSLSSSFFGLSGFASAAWRSSAAERSSEKMASPRSAVRYCTTSFQSFL